MPCYARHGAYETFDIEFARAAVGRVARARPDAFFLLLNTPPFLEPRPPNVTIA
jgi:hypothetical protein